MSREAQKIVHQLREEGLGDEEIVWYAVNMHDADEDEIRAELQRLQPAAQQPAAEQPDERQDVQSPSEWKMPGGGTGEPVAAKAAKTGRSDGNDDREAVAAPPSSSGALADNGYWIALKVIVLSSIVSSFSTQLFVVPDLPYHMEDQVASMLYYLAFGGLVIWAILRQVEIAVPGSRLAGASRPILYGLFLVAGNYTLSAVMWPEYMPGPAYYVEMTLVSLLFLEILTLLRRWLVPAGILFFVALHVVMINGLGLAAMAFSEALQTGGSFFALFMEFPPYILEATAVEKAAMVLLSVAEVMVCWVLFAFCGKHHPGRTLSEWGASVQRLPARLLRGEFGFARSFWYFAALGWIPLRILNQYALYVESAALLIAFSVLNAVFWALVGYVLWQAARGYSGSKAWPVLAGLFVLLGFLASGIALVGLEG